MLSVILILIMVLNILFFALGFLLLVKGAGNLCGIHVLGDHVELKICFFIRFGNNATSRFTQSHFFFRK